MQFALAFAVWGYIIALISFFYKNYSTSIAFALIASMIVFGVYLKYSAMQHDHDDFYE
jgi:hypothetical protein